MSVIRVQKSENYTVMSNIHLRDKNLSLKAKGLLSVVLSLSEEWQYSISGLTSICKESELAVKNALGELKENGYLKINKLMPNETKSGKIEYEYVFYENGTLVDEKNSINMQQQEDIKQEVDYQGVDYQGVDYQGQLNTIILNTNILNTKYNNIKGKKTFGEYKNVKLKDDEFEKLVSEYGEDITNKAIEFLDCYIEEKGYKSKSNYLAIRRWVVDAVKNNKSRNTKVAIKVKTPAYYGKPMQKQEKATPEQIAEINQMLKKSKEKNI